MAVTVATIISRVDQLIRDSSTNSVSQADRLRAISMASQELMVEWGFDLSSKSYTLNYFDTVNYYDVTGILTNFADIIDIRRKESEHEEQFHKKSPDELAVEVNLPEDFSYTVERYDTNVFLGLSYQSKYTATTIHDCESLTSNGTWTLDTTNGDGTNLELDDSEFEVGTASIKFDADVSQTAFNRVRIYNSGITSLDLSDDEGLSSVILRVYIPDATDFTSVTAYWGSSSSNYWSAAATTDINSNSFSDGWNRIKIDWSAATATGSPDSSAVDFIQLDLNYAAGYTDQTGFRIDDILVVKPEKLKLLYQSWTVGTSNSGTPLSEFAATDDVPFWSGQYDFINNFIAMKAASILFRQMDLQSDANNMESLASIEKNRIKKMFPARKSKEVRNFKVKGLSW